MHFTKGQIIFAICFTIVFIVALIWAYRKDKSVTLRHFKGVAPKLILTIIAIYSLIFLIIKLMH
ncbi:MAG TPA: hypothetical protein VGO45_03100 [Bacteroidia bacterium]|nr:hypothetical protein [Bacteroidia bacterium]